MAHNAYHKVIWSEGMLVGPHHFQQWDRYYEALLDLRLRPLIPCGWGVGDLTIDRELLENSGILRLERFRGILASGVAVDLPLADGAPPSRPVTAEAFVAPANRLDVYLALPLDRPQSANVRPPGDAAGRVETRYLPAFVTVVDESSGENEQEVVTAQKNLRLLFGNEPGDNLERIKIAELVRQGDGRIILDEGYIPPSLHLATSPYLQKVVQTLLAGLVTKSKALTSALPQRSPDGYDWRTVAPETLWVLPLLNAAIPLLSHFCQLPVVHPEVVFRHLIQLAGQLSTLAVDLEPTDLPHYDHADLTATFTQVVRILQRLLNLIALPFPSNFMVVELAERITARGYPVWCVRYALDPCWLTGDYQFHLAIRAVAVEAKRQRELSDLLPELLTIAAQAAIDEAIELAYGVTVTPTAAPAAAPARPGVAYFCLAAGGRAWESIQSGQTLALYLPPEFLNEFKEFAVELVLLPVQPPAPQLVEHSSCAPALPATNGKRLPHVTHYPAVDKRVGWEGVRR